MAPIRYKTAGKVCFGLKAVVRWGVFDRLLLCLRIGCIVSFPYAYGMTQIMPLKPVEHKKTRISAKLRRAIDLRVRKGLTIAQACEEAGYAQSAWYEAMKRPAIQEALREAQSVFVAEAEKMRGTAKARAIEVAVDLMMNAKSETVRARMVAGPGIRWQRWLRHWTRIWGVKTRARCL